MHDTTDERENSEVPFVAEQSATLGRAYHEWQRRERNLVRLRELAAPDLIIESEVRLRDKSLEALRSLGWTGGPVRIHHTPYDLDRAESPAGARVLLLALVLASMSERAILEADGELEAIPELQDWAQCLDEEFQSSERAVVMSAPGTLSEQDLSQSSWLIEGAAVLTWALGLGEPLPYDRMCKPSLVKEQLGFFEPDRLTRISAPTLRPRGEIVKEFERMWAIHWRLTDYRIRQEVMRFEDLAKRSPFWFGPLATDGIPTAPVRKPHVEVADMAIRGHAISQATDEDRRQCESIVVERRQALGWASGLAVAYSDVSMDT